MIVAGCVAVSGAQRTQRGALVVFRKCAALRAGSLEGEAVRESCSQRRWVPVRQPSKREDLSVDQKAGKGIVIVGRAAKENPEEEEKTLVTTETVYVKS